MNDIGKLSTFLQNGKSYCRKKFYSTGPRLERLGSYKHSSLMSPFVSYEENEVFWIPPQKSKFVLS